MDAYVGEIRMFGGHYAPVGWLLCNGQIMSVTTYSQLFSLLGTAYGGDGRSTFGIPDMRGRVPVHYGTGSGLTARSMGQRYGSEYVTLSIDQIPEHSHPMIASTDTAYSNLPEGRVLAAGQAGVIEFYAATTDASKVVLMNESAVLATGSGTHHINVMPSLAISFIIATTGIYPSQS
ncbi:MAG: phage tail protein [Opitutales bacterium]|nr:phage tail protein [Opitutales bacterium]